MKRFIIYIIGIFLVILENSVINYIDIFGASFSVLIPFLVLISLYLEDYDAGIAGLITGLVRDITVGGIFGLNAILLSVICYTIGHFRKNLYRDSMSMIMGLIMAVSAAYSLIYAFVSYFMYFTDGILLILIRAAVVVPVMNMIAGFVIYKLFNSLILKLNEE